MKSPDFPLQALKNIAHITAEALSTSPLDHHVTRRHVEALLFLKLIDDIGKDLTCRNPIATSIPAWATFTFSPEHEWRSLQSGKDLPLRLNLAIHVVESTNPELLGGTFTGVDFREISGSDPGIIERLVHAISDADFRPSRFGDAGELGKTFEYLSDKVATTSRLGEFNAPPEVAKLIADLVDPKTNESIMDPVCGSGRLLAAMARHTDLRSALVAGQDWRTRPLSLCKMTLFAHGVSARIETGDPLSFPLRDEHGDTLRADVVIGNPPFGLRPERGSLQNTPKVLQGLNLRVRSELAFVLHMLETAREGSGRVAAIVPLGALFRQEEIEIRRRLVEDNLLAGVIALPAKLFTETKIAVAILILKKKRRNSGVLFMDASRKFVASGGLNRLLEQDSEWIVNSFRNFKGIRNFCHVATLREIQENDFHLNVKRYVSHNGSEKNGGDLEEMKADIAETELELAEVRREIEALLESLDMKA